MKVSKFGPVAFIIAVLGLAGCSVTQAPTNVPGASIAAANFPDYVIGPYDQLRIFVWRAPELSSDVAVRPDGRISTPLVDDMVAAGKSPAVLAQDIERSLANFVRSPEVTVIVSNFSSTVEQQIRVLGEAAQPAALPYQVGMTTLDVMIAVGGLTDFAAGNRAKLIRGRGEDKQVYRIRLNDLMRHGDVSADVPMQPGDVILIPESIF
ncbi:MAG: polysaccharide biosynthesis/export family protein [Parvularculaceae bacterium]|nr:polysaccharide biosynthesis/export family protein [Parvularculaceae bacterium]